MTSKDEGQQPDASSENGGGEELEELEELIAACLREMERSGVEALEEMCQQHSEHADILRRRISMLDLVGGSEAGQAPAQIGPYRILDVLGEGGMGIVYLAEQRQPIHRRVALKVIKMGMDTKEVLGRFEVERQALAMMEHPNIAKVYEAGATDTGRPYFAMEHVKGVAITDYCDRHRLNMRERLELFVPVCLAVQHAHDKGILHRDLKPGNVLVTIQDGRPVPKIIDFGIAKATNQRLTERTFFTEEGRIIGTPEYMSPEQAEMSGLDVDARTDVYSLGVMLYELLTGHLPFDPQQLREAGYLEIQRLIREEEPPKPSTRASTLGEGLAEVSARRHTDSAALLRQLRGDLDWITMRSLEKDRTRRYETARGLAEDIGRHLDRQPVKAGPPGLYYRLGRFGRRHRGRVAAVLLILVAVTVAAWGTALAFENSRLMRERDEALVQAREAVGNTRQEWEKETAATQSEEESWAGDKQRLEEEGARLQARLQEITRKEEASSIEILRLKLELQTTRKNLASYNPVDLEQQRLVQIAKVEKACVIVHVLQTYVHSTTGQNLFYSEDAEGVSGLNLKGEGNPFSKTKAASGFCVSSEGWIMTVAQVVKTEAATAPIVVGQAELVPKLQITVGFSGQTKKYEAKLVRSASDLALLKIDPFKDMPHVDGIDLEIGQPRIGTEVFLVGFPVARAAVPKDKLLASVFRGITSRSVGGYLQIDSAIHPGNSGGPLIDGKARVLGVVLGMQRSSGGGDPSMGYVVPIMQAKAIWPPK